MAISANSSSQVSELTTCVSYMTLYQYVSISLSNRVKLFHKELRFISVAQTKWVTLSICFIQETEYPLQSLSNQYTHLLCWYLTRKSPPCWPSSVLSFKDMLSPLERMTGGFSFPQSWVNRWELVLDPSYIPLRKHFIVCLFLCFLVMPQGMQDLSSLTRNKLVPLQWKQSLNH